MTQFTLTGFSAPLAALALSTLVATAASAQKMTPLKTGGGGSPHVRAEWTIDGGNLAIEYGRPQLKGRTPGKDVEPMQGQEWRTGADEATTLKTDKMLMFGSLHVPAGSYTVYTMPSGDTWHLILSKETGQWGTPYPGKAKDLGRAPMKLSSNAKPVEQLTISIEDTASGGTLHIDWGATRASIPFTVG